jgi:hypothetical protein
MTIYSSTDYRKIYEAHYGTIPLDDEGRTYEIHHIDGNNSNNDPSNLVAVTIQEHYDIHYSQKDYRACFLIATQRMNKTPEEISELARKAALKRVEDGTHNWLNGDIQRATNQKRVNDGTHHFLGGEVQRKRVAAGTHNFSGPDHNLTRVKNGTHPFVGGEVQRKRVAEGKHNFLGSENNAKRLAEGNHNFTQQWTCEHCGKEGKNQAAYARWHGARCRNKN